MVHLQSLSSINRATSNTSLTSRSSLFCSIDKGIYLCTGGGEMCHVDTFIVDPSVSLSKSGLLRGTFKCAKDWTRAVIHQQRQQSSIAGSESHTFLCGTTTLTRQFPILEDGELIKRSRFLCSLNPFHWYRHFSSVQRHIQRRKCWYEEGKRAALTRVETGHVRHGAMWDTVEDFVMSESHLD